MQNDKLKTVLASLKSEREQLAAKSEPLKAKRTALQEKMQPMEVEARELTKQIRAIEGGQLVTLDKQIGVIARALGAKSINASPEQANKANDV